MEPILNKILYKYRDIELLQEEINELGRDAERVYNSYAGSDEDYSKEQKMYMENIRSYMSVC